MFKRFSSSVYETNSESKESSVWKAWKIGGEVHGDVTSNCVTDAPRKRGGQFSFFVEPMDISVQTCLLSGFHLLAIGRLFQLHPKNS